MSGKLLSRCICPLDSLALPSHILTTLHWVLFHLPPPTHFRGPYWEDLDIRTIKCNHVYTYTHTHTHTHTHTQTYILVRMWLQATEMMLGKDGWWLMENQAVEGRIALTQGSNEDTRGRKARLNHSPHSQEEI